MSERVKTTIFEGLLMPILIYGSDNGTLTSRERSSFQTTERKTLEKKRDRFRNYTIREQLEVAPLIKKIEEGQLR